MHVPWLDGLEDVACLQKSGNPLTDFFTQSNQSFDFENCALLVVGTINQISVYFN